MSRIESVHDVGQQGVALQGQQSVSYLSLERYLLLCSSRATSMVYELVHAASCAVRLYRYVLIIFIDICWYILYVFIYSNRLRCN